MADSWKQMYEAQCARLDEYQARQAVALGLPSDYGVRFGWVGLESEALRLRERADRERAQQPAGGSGHG